MVRAVYNLFPHISPKSYFIIGAADDPYSISVVSSSILVASFINWVDFPFFKVNV